MGRLERMKHGSGIMSRGQIEWCKDLYECRYKMDQDDFIIWICCSLNFGFVYYESIKRELHIKPTVFVNVGVMKD